MVDEQETLIPDTLVSSLLSETSTPGWLGKAVYYEVYPARPHVSSAPFSTLSSVSMPPDIYLCQRHTRRDDQSNLKVAWSSFIVVGSINSASYSFPAYVAPTIDLNLTSGDGQPWIHINFEYSRALRHGGSTLIHYGKGSRPTPLTIPSH